MCGSADNFNKIIKVHKTRLNSVLFDVIREFYNLTFVATLGFETEELKIIYIFFKLINIVTTTDIFNKIVTALKTRPD